MEFTQLLTDIQDKSLDKKGIAEHVAEEPSHIPDLITALEDKKARIRYGCAKILHLLSETHPDLLYPYFDSFTSLLKNENNIIRAEALYVLSQLALVDTDNRIEAVLEDYLAPIKGPVLMVAANAIQGGARIALAKPECAGRIADAILAVPEASYKTEECVQVASGEAIMALDAFTQLVIDIRPIRKFIQSQRRSSRKGTRARAEKVLKRRGW